MIVAMPLVMGRAMSLHNNAVRKAAWTHFGFIVGQEGDSYILAFSDALDAVAFCLQVGLMLFLPMCGCLLKLQLFSCLQEDLSAAFDNSVCYSLCRHHPAPVHHVLC